MKNDEALEKLAEFERRRCEIVKMRIGGLDRGRDARRSLVHPKHVMIARLEGAKAWLHARAYHGRDVDGARAWQRITTI